MQMRDIRMQCWADVKDAKLGKQEGWRWNGWGGEVLRKQSWGNGEGWGWNGGEEVLRMPKRDIRMQCWGDVKDAEVRL